MTLGEKRKSCNRMDKEDYAMDQVVSFFRSKAECKMQDDADVIFSKNIGLPFKKNRDKSVQEYNKLNVQELLYQARCGGLHSPQASISMQQQYAISHSPLKSPPFNNYNN